MKKFILAILVIGIVLVASYIIFQTYDLSEWGDKTIKNQICTKGYTENYICSGNWTLKKYQKENCSTEWVKWENCDLGCNNGNCDLDCNNGICKKAMFHFHRAEIELWEYEGWKTSKTFSYDSSKIISDKAKVGEKLFITGNIKIDLEKDISMNGVIREEQVNIRIYKDNLELYSESVFTDDSGKFRTEKFIPKETGYYKIVFKIVAGTEQTSFTEDGTWMPFETTFYVSE